MLTSPQGIELLLRNHSNFDNPKSGEDALVRRSSLVYTKMGVHTYGLGTLRHGCKGSGTQHVLEQVDELLGLLYVGAG